jgi:tight adherence protein C
MMSEIAGAPALIALAAFLVMFLLLVGIVQYAAMHGKRKEMVEKIQQSSGTWVDAAVTSHPPEISGESKGWMIGLFASLGKKAVSPESKDYSRMNMKFLRAGLRRPNVPAIYWGIKSFLCLSFAVFFLLTRLTFFHILSFNVTIAICLYVAAVGFYLPDIWLALRISSRKKSMMEGLPDALDLMVVCVEAGMGLDAAIHRVGQEMRLTNKVLSDELQLLNLELRAGKSRQDAFRDLAKRSGLEEVESLVTLLIQTDRFGTSVAQALRVYSDSFRTKRFQKAEEIAGKLSVKLMFPMIFFIFPALFVAILGPAAIRVYEIFLNH